MHIIISILAASLLGSYLLTSNWAATFIAALICSVLSLLVLTVELIRKNGKAGPSLYLAVGSACIGVALYGAFMANYAIARHRTLEIAAACEEYRADTKSYPKELSILVPKYIAAIPWAKYTIMYGQFHYDGFKVFFSNEPGMPMPAYDLAKKEWTSTPVFSNVPPSSK